MPGLQSLNAQAQPMTGDASIEAALAALSPQDQAKLAAGIDPLADGSAAPSVNGGVPGAVPNIPVGTPITPEIIQTLLMQPPYISQDAGTRTSVANLTDEEKILLAKQLSDLLTMTSEPVAPQDLAANQAAVNSARALGYDSLSQLPVSNMVPVRRNSADRLTTENVQQIKEYLEQINNTAKGNVGPYIDEVLAMFSKGGF